MESLVHKEDKSQENVPFRFIDRDKLKGRSTGINWECRLFIYRSF